MYKECPTEFEVQAVAYNLLIQAGYITRGEVKVKPKNQRGCRFDLVVYDNTFKPVLVIEVKDNPKAPPHAKKAYYEQVAGCPCIQVSGIQEALEVVRTVNNTLSVSII